MACAELFAKNDWNLILAGRRLKRLESLSQKLSSEFEVSIEIIQMDVRNKTEVFEKVDSLKPEISDNVQILINNAGLAVGKGPIDSGLTDDWERMIDTNITGLLYVSKVVIPLLKKNKHGHIINIASIAGKEVYPGGNVYCATKHAVDALSKSMRIDLLPHNIKVTNIAPGAVDTEFSLVRFKGDQKTANDVYEGFTPLYAEDIAESIYFVVSRPSNVNINDLVIMPTAQANPYVLNKVE